MEIKSSKPISLADAKEILSERSKESEMGYEQTQSLESMERFSRHPKDKSEKLIANLKENKKITSEIAVKLVDIAPDNPSTVRAIVSKEKLDLSDEEIEQIIKEVA